MTDLTPDEKADLRKAAEEATPGPWRAGANDTDCVFGDVNNPALMAPFFGRVLLRTNHHFPRFEADARFIAAANPAVVIALLDENARLEAEVSELVQHAQASQTELAQGWAKLREEKRAIRELAWDAGRNSTDERNPYR